MIKIGAAIRTLLPALAVAAAPLAMADEPPPPGAAPAAPAAAAPGAGPAPAPGNVPPISDLSAPLRKIADALEAAPGWEVDAEESWTIREMGKETTGKNRYELAVQDPGRFALRVWPEGDKLPAMAAICDGETLTTRIGQPEPLHAASRPRDPAEGLSRNPILHTVFNNALMDLFVRKDFAEYFGGSYVAPRDRGVEDLGGKKARHYRGGWGDGRILELWLDEAAPNLPLRARWTRTVPPAQAGQPPFELVSDIRFDWKVGGEIPAETFQIQLPEGSKLVDDLYATLTGSGKSLVPGQPFPKLDLELLGGAEFDLKAHEGKEIIVLNFWATWDPAGLESLPTLAKFAEEFRGKGVAIYHVNMGEPEEAVSAYLAKVNLPLLVVLDPEGEAMDACSISSLPFSVIIGKDGKIAVVNAGELRGFRERFRQQIDALLAGKSPAAATQPAEKPAAEKK